MVTLLVHNHIDDGEDHTLLGQELSHIGLIKASNPLASHSTPTEVQSFSIGAGHPPVPGKLVKKIESGAFVDMVELLPERLDTADSEDAKLKKKKVAFHTGMTSVLCCLRCRGGQKTTWTPS